MTEYWGWALSHATGEWQVLLVKMMGCNHIFFSYLINITNIAKDKKLERLLDLELISFGEDVSMSMAMWQFDIMLKIKMR